MEEGAGKRCSECGSDAALVPQSCNYPGLSEGADSVGGQLRGDEHLRAPSVASPVLAEFGGRRRKRSSECGSARLGHHPGSGYTHWGGPQLQTLFVHAGQNGGHTQRGGPQLQALFVHTGQKRWAGFWGRTAFFERLSVSYFYRLIYIYIYIYIYFFFNLYKVNTMLSVFAH